MALSPGQIVATLTPIVGRVGAAGIAGNLMQESGNDPGRAGGGLAQWQGPRYTGLVKYAQARGLPTTSAQAALGYLAQDLKGPYAGLANQLRSAKDPGHAATLFSNIYERPGIPMLGNRINYANQALGGAGKGAQALPQPPGLPGLPGAGPQTQSTTVPTFNQAGFQKANRAYIVGNFLSHQQGPYDTGGSGSNPLFTSGLASTTAPNPQDFQGTKTIKTIQLAQSSLQHAAQTVLQTHPAAAGKVQFASQARIGLQPILLNTLSQASGGIGRPLYVGTGKVGHSTYTVNGNVSEHTTGHAADLLASRVGLTNEALGQALYRYFTGSKAAPAGGLFNIQWHGHRIQLIYQTMEGGNHYTHVHVGIR